MNNASGFLNQLLNFSFQMLLPKILYLDEVVLPDPRPAFGFLGKLIVLL